MVGGEPTGLHLDFGRRYASPRSLIEAVVGEGREGRGKILRRRMSNDVMGEPLLHEVGRVGFLI